MVDPFAWLILAWANCIRQAGRYRVSLLFPPPLLNEERGGNNKETGCLIQLASSTNMFVDHPIMKDFPIAL